MSKRYLIIQKNTIVLMYEPMSEKFWTLSYRIHDNKELSDLKKSEPWPNFSTIYSLGIAYVHIPLHQD